MASCSFLIFSSRFSSSSIGFFRILSDCIGYMTRSNLCSFINPCLASSDNSMIRSSAFYCLSFTTSSGSCYILSSKVWWPDLNEAWWWPWDRDFCDLDYEIYEVADTCDLFICLIGVSVVTSFFLKLTWLSATRGRISIQIIIHKLIAGS